MPSGLRRKSFQLVVTAFIILGIGGNFRWSIYSSAILSSLKQDSEPNDTPDSPNDTNSRSSVLPSIGSRRQPLSPVFDIVSVGSLKRPEYQKTQKATFGSDPHVRNFFSITEVDDVDDCHKRLTWRDVQAISGYCGGLRTDIRNKHRLLYALRTKFANPEWLERTKADPAAWLCAQKRPMVGMHRILKNQQDLPDFLIIMDDDTYYNMQQVQESLLSLQKEQFILYNDDSIVIAGCVIRGRLKRFKWTFPFGGWGTVFSRGTLEVLLEPLYCAEFESNTTNDNVSILETTAVTSNLNLTWSAKFCPKLLKDRLGEFQVYHEGMSLLDVMYAYVVREPYVDHANWSLGFCLHSDWVWGYMANYYNISIALGRRSKDVMVDRLGAYNGSEMNPAYSEGVLKLRRQCDFDSDQNCTKDAHMCHYVTPQHMKYLWSLQTQQ